MYFVDSSGHSFYQQSFGYRPIGYENYKNKYVFWIDNKDHSYCSINNYYIRPIYVLSNEKALSVGIVCNSDVFRLLSSTNLSERFLNGSFSIDELDMKNELNYDKSKENINENDIIELEVTSSNDTLKYMYPFYVIGCSTETGSIMTNVLIRVEYETRVDYCYITVGGEFSDESEILYINGRNMGVNLPHEIIRAVYNGSYINNEFDEVLYNEKLKEYLIEYMQIRGQVGNYNSAIQSLKWFGWGKHISIVSLLETDNQFIVQFVRDFFNVDSDILDSFKHFVNTTLLSLIVNENIETGEYNSYDLTKDFIGENQPTLENLFEKQVAVKYGGVGEETYYYKNYYNFMFSELMYKLSALKYYYEKYFLPVHLSIHNASLHHKVYANDIKMLFNSNEFITEPITKIGLWRDNIVEFPANNELWLTEQVHYVDELFNEWKYDSLDEYSQNKDIYYIHDTCVNIPIKFLNYTTDENSNIVYNDEQVNVHMILEKIIHDNESSDNIDNVLYINTPFNLYSDELIIYDITNHKIDLNDVHISYSTDGGKNYSTYFYGMQTLKDVMHVNNTYVLDVMKVIGNDKYVVRHNNRLYVIGEEDRYVNIYDNENNITKIIHIPSINDIRFDLLNNGGECTVEEFFTVLLRIKIPNDKINKCEILSNDIIKDITENISITYASTSDIFYESSFTFNPKYEQYYDLVIYPKMFNNVSTDSIYNRHGLLLTNKKLDITYFINGKFRLRMLVNNKWYSYDFVIRMPDVNIDFGKLVYKYYDDEFKYTRKFNQLSDLSDTSLQFNAFMHEPGLARNNDINFLENFLRYINISTARYIDGSIIPSDEFCYYIDIKFIDNNTECSQRVYINNNNLGKDLYIPRKYFRYDIIFYLFMDPSLLYLFVNTGNNNVYEIFGTEDNTLMFENDIDDFNVYNDPNNFKKFIYNSDDNTYSVETSYGIIKFNINETLRNDSSSLMNKYIETHNITNNYKYLNQIHVFDLYRLNDHSGDNILMLQNNIDMRYHGIRFTHTSFTTGNHIHISGNTNNLITNSNVRNTNAKTFESSLDIDDSNNNYSTYINTYDDLTIYSAYEGDYLQPIGDDVIEPTGYIYYEEVNANGIPTGNFTSNNISIVGVEKELHIINTIVDEYGNKSKSELEYIDIRTFTELKKLFGSLTSNSETDSETAQLRMNEYNEFNDYSIYINDDSSMFINRDNINSEKSPIFYMCEFIYQDKQNNKTVINPTYSEYHNIISKSLADDNNYSYYIRIRFYVLANMMINNIQRIYNGEATFENNEWTAIINGRTVNVYPFYSEYDNNDDRLFNVKSLINQPGFDWVDINDLDNTIDYINQTEDDDNILLLDPSDINNNDNQKNYDNDNDIKHLLSYRKLLILNVTTRLINAIIGYETTTVFKDCINNYVDSNGENDNIKLTFKMKSNQISDNDAPKIMTVLRAKYRITNKTTNKTIEGYDYFDDEHDFIINSKIIKYDKDIFHIKLYNNADESKYNVYHYFMDENGNEICKEYFDFVAFFIIMPNNTSDVYSDKEFALDINPSIRLTYKDYDLLEYPIDSFVDNINYNDNTYSEYTINDTNYRYGDCRKSQSVIKLYNEFFNKNEITYKNKNKDILYSFISVDSIDELNIDNNLVEYDMYLMHDIKNWYIIYISKNTCDKSLALYDYEAADEITFISKDNNKYKLIKNISTKKFLVNRYVYSSKNGKYHFKTDDIIVGKVLNNNRLPIDIFKSNKWEMTPVSFAVDKMTHTAKSNADMCIFDVPMYNDKYVKGYYDITYRYSLDRISTQQYKKYGTIRIE